MIAVWRGPVGRQLRRGLAALSLFAAAVNAAAAPHEMAAGESCDPLTAAESDAHHLVHGAGTAEITAPKSHDGPLGVSAASDHDDCDHCPANQCAVTPTCSVSSAQMAAAQGPGQVILPYASPAAVIAPQVLQSTAPAPPTPPPQPLVV